MGWIYTISQQASRVVFSAYFGVRVFDRENVPLTGPAIILSNHQSYLDPVICGVGLQRELDYMARESLFRNPLFAAYIRALNAFPIQRGEADVGALREIIRRLKDGRAVTMYPEATRTSDGRIRTIKAGFDLIARRSRAPVIPTVIDGAFEAWPRHRLFPGMGRIYVQYGRPISPEEIKSMDRRRFVNEINQRLRNMQTELRRRVNRRPFRY